MRGVDIRLHAFSVDVTVTHEALEFPGKSPTSPLDRRLGGSHNQSGPMPRVELRFFIQTLATSHYTL
jgi:hypothetical protein